MPQVTIVWSVTSRFRNPDLLSVLRDFKSDQRKPTNEYEIGFWKVNGLSVKLYAKKLVVQGNLDDYNKKLLSEIERIDGLSLDQENASKLRSLFPTKQNALLCEKCNSPSLLVAAVRDGLDIAFKKECGHSDKLTPPLMMLNSRILPDMNILISKSLSRLVALGHFVGFEILIPEFILDILDQFKGSGKKEAVSKELANLRIAEGQNRVRILALKEKLFEISSESLSKEEDKILLRLANLTNSILVTSDQVLKDRALMDNRPTIFIPAEVFSQIKMIDEVRNP